MNQRSPLASLDLSDDRVPSNGDFLVEKLAETRRAFETACDRNEQLEQVVRGLLRMVEQIGSRPDVSQELRKAFLTHPRVWDAQEVLL